MKNFINVFDRSIKKVAVLQNAFDITETQELNKIYTLTFSMPLNDTKNEFCKPFNYVRWANDGQLYRIIKISTDDSEKPVVTYECEHVVACLCDSVLFGSFVYGGGTIKTPEVIRWLLDQQKEKNWELDECDFERRFEYGWEQENLLNALYAIPKEFSTSYKWQFDTSGYPWKISLKAIDVTQKPEYYIRAKRNLIKMDSTETNTDICTRLYPLGYGEGVNQLTIKEVNNDIPYLQSPPEIVNRYGIIEKVLVDRRFENAESLKEYGQTVLDGIQSPSYTRSFDVADLYPLTSETIDNAEVGKICRLTMDNTVVYITKTVRKLDQPGDLQIELSNKAINIADSIADLADRVRIESVYAQGATQLYQHSKDANATKDKGMEINLYFPAEMKQINKVLLKIQLESFRAYSQSTGSNEAVSDTTEDGGQEGSTASSDAGSVSTTSGSVTFSGSLNIGVSEWSGRNIDSATYSIGGITSTDNGNGNHSHTWRYGDLRITIPAYALAHTHNASVDLAKLGEHSHSIYIPSHRHSFSVAPHKHRFSVPAHTHDIKPGIYTYGNPQRFDIYVDGVKKKTVNGTSCEEDITALLLNKQKQVPRDSWIKVEIRPNDLAYVVSSVFVQGFVQSRGGGNY